MKIDLYHGDCLEVLRTLPDNSIGSVVTDPPYGLSPIKQEKVNEVLVKWISGDREAMPTGKGFMAMDWDRFVPPPAVWDEVLRVLKPGGYMAVFAAPRTQHLMGLSLSLAGFEIKNTLYWLFGSGFPKGQSISKQIESTLVNGKANSRSLRKTEMEGDGAAYSLTGKNNGIMGEVREYDRKEFAATTEEAQKWEGYNTQLKPAAEPILLVQKPIEETYAKNTLNWGVGGLNIDACRVGTEGGGTHCGNRDGNGKCLGHGDSGKSQSGATVHSDETGGSAGRFPANVLLDEHAAAEMDKQSGVSKSQRSTRKKAGETVGNGVTLNNYHMNEDNVGGYSDSGGASRFFPVFRYTAKANKSERPSYVNDEGKKVAHPSVKPQAVTDWLVTLITPPGEQVLDLFAGTGGVGLSAEKIGSPCILIESHSPYLPLIEQKVPSCQLISTE